MDRKDIQLRIGQPRPEDMTSAERQAEVERLLADLGGWRTRRIEKDMAKPVARSMP